MASKDDDGHKRIAENRRARFDYHIEETWEAGIELTGTEVKSLRSGQANIAESYASAEQGGIFLINAYIPEYTKAGAFFQHDPRRRRFERQNNTECRPAVDYARHFNPPAMAPHNILCNP